MGDKPDLLAVAYTSVARQAFDDESLTALLDGSRRWNASVGITGLLMHRKGRFIQFLEGPERTVRELVANISKDRRHSRVRVLLEEKVVERQFSDWSMGFRLLDDTTAMPEGFRTSFDDLESGDDSILMVQAARQLTWWFRETGPKVS